MKSWDVDAPFKFFFDIILCGSLEPLYKDVYSAIKSLAEMTDWYICIGMWSDILHRIGVLLSYMPLIREWSDVVRPHFYQTRSAWSMDQGSNENHSPVNNFAPTVTKFCVMWEGQALPHDTKFGNCRDKIVDSRAFLIWSLIHGSSWSGLIKVGPAQKP